MAAYIHPVLPTDIRVNQDAVHFFDAFYKTSDTPSAHEAYTHMFTPDATFVVASRKSIGHTQILALRKGMWSAVASRHHSVHKIFPFGQDANEFMLYGVVEYTAQTGQQSSKEWSARAVLEKDDAGHLRLQYYQVYLDTAAPSS